MQPKTYIAYSPGKLGSIFALFYFDSSVDIYGWHIETKNLYFSAAFFMVENFYANHPPRLYRSVEDDIYGPWTIDFPPTKNEIRCPVPEATGHELERVQSKFVEEWLFFKNDISIDTELEAYKMHELPIQQVNIKARRLHRFQKEDNAWIYTSPGINLNVVPLLRKYWRLSEKVPTS